MAPSTWSFRQSGRIFIFMENDNSASAIGMVLCLFHSPPGTRARDLQPAPDQVCGESMVPTVHLQRSLYISAVKGYQLFRADQDA